MSTQKANRILLDIGILENLERKGKLGVTKRFKSLTDQGLYYGRNETNPNNPRETQPLYYTSKANELITLIKENA